MHKKINKVQQRLYKQQKVFIRQRTIINIYYQLQLAGYSVSIENIYLNCIVDGINSLIEYNKEIGLKSYIHNR